MTLPTAENVPELDFNVEGLKRHFFLDVILLETPISKNERKLRSWLLHTLVTAARHYARARELVMLQDKANQEDANALFYVFDLSEQIESCISATFRICSVIKQKEKNDKDSDSFSKQHSDTLEKLKNIRNQFEHAHGQVVSGETGSGPILMTFSDSGRTIKFRKLQLETVHLYDLIKALYFVVADLYPTFDVNSAPEVGDPMKLSVTEQITRFPTD